ncbi:MAG: DUF3084 domain-containing protein [Candidatus Wallbacteria bacterium]|nr:DUF3084 domain-containing protein [Candidatus Wallbacteria bacterium]
MTFNSFVRLFFLIVLSGFLAYLGDLLGYRLGKKRLSLFSLRPKITAQLIAVVTGIMIMVFTLMFAAFISEDVRVALFNIDKLIDQQKELIGRNEELNKQNLDLRESSKLLQDSINDKIKKIQELEESVAQKKEGELAFSAGEVIGYRALNPAQPDQVLLEEFKKLVTQIVSMSKARGAIPREFQVIWNESQDQRDKLLEFCKKVAQDRSQLVVIVHCQQNVFKGEEMGKISFTVEKNQVVLAGDYLYSIKNFVIDGCNTREEISLFLRYFFNQLDGFLKDKGMVERTMINELDFYDTVNYIKRLGEKVQLYIYFKDDLYLYEQDLATKYKLVIEKLSDNKPEKVNRERSNSGNTAEVDTLEKGVQ